MASDLPQIERTDTGWIITHPDGVITDGGKAGISPWMHDGRLFCLVGAQWWLVDLESGDMSKAYVRTELGGRNNIPAVHPLGYYLATSFGVQVRDGSHDVIKHLGLHGEGRWSLGAHHGPGNTAYVYQELSGYQNRVMAVDSGLEVIDELTIDVWHELYLSERFWYLRKRGGGPWQCSMVLDLGQKWTHVLSHPAYRGLVMIGGANRQLVSRRMNDFVCSVPWVNGHAQIADTKCVASYWDGQRDSKIGVFETGDLTKVAEIPIDPQPITHGSRMQPPWNTYSTTDPGIWVRAVPAINWHHDKIAYRVPTEQGVPSVHVVRLGNDDELRKVKIENEKMRKAIADACDILAPWYGTAS